uniref:Uncharacterized protein n=1 Tax=Anguilla anguilla TaxID=7936 RepID=A0A0E9QXL1_ANGAN
MTSTAFRVKLSSDVRTLEEVHCSVSVSLTQVHSVALLQHRYCTSGQLFIVGKLKTRP